MTEITIENISIEDISPATRDAVKKALGDQNIDAVADDSKKGILRSLGDSGSSPNNVSGNTLLWYTNTIKTRLDDIQASLGPTTSSGSSTGAGLTVVTDLSGNDVGRSRVDVWVQSSTDATFKIQGSIDNTNWRDVATLSTSGTPADNYSGYDNAFPHFRVFSTNKNDNEIEIAASR